MKLALFSHCTIDSIVIDGNSHEQIGGAACYGGLTARNFKFDVELFTKFGKDFPYRYLSENQIKFENASSDKPTTRFRLEITGAERQMFLENKCDDLEYTSCDADGFLVSPLCGEISSELFEKIKQDANFLFLDPQGFLRRTDSQNKVFLEKTSLNLQGVDAIKLNPEELAAIEPGDFEVTLKAIQKQGPKHVLYTNKTEISLLYEDRLYSLSLPNKEVYDTTGIGDIFSATFACTLLKEKDFLWAFCFAGGSAQAALDTKEIGLLKVPERGAIETNASYFYNTIKFRQI
ncbi:ribokinase [Nitrosopumilus sp. b1]|uniref:PfkB family carbohydrate kinase n=1 Tax=Nitrosopumilus sp. b1 TaxID=2109907 RepID=UPI0015F3E4E6|nr:PfkB family carbohydrate kinase [Nitrosopumilus sp. b1]KAF6243323.1 ribokinase [Nitrosopumilus sp. b1]